MPITLKTPVCNLIACEDIAINSDNKVFICNPFTGTAGRNIKKFYTYAVIQGIPNGMLTFKIQIVRPNGSMVKETENNTILVEENIIRAKTQWLNVNFNECGEHIVQVLIKCNNEFEVVGSSYICIL